jgi:hypothetical protein
MSSTIPGTGDGAYEDEPDLRDVEELPRTQDGQEDGLMNGYGPLCVADNGDEISQNGSAVDNGPDIAHSSQPQPIVGGPVAADETSSIPDDTPSLHVR